MLTPEQNQNRHRLDSSEWTQRYGDRAPEIGTDPFASDYGDDDPRSSDERDFDAFITTYPHLAEFYQDYETETDNG